MNARPLSRSLTILAVGLASLSGPRVSSQGSQAGTITVLSRAGQRPLPFTMVNDQQFVALDDLAALFQVVVHEDSPGAITVSYKASLIVLTSDQSLASVAGRLVSLPAPPTRMNRRWMVPIEFVSRALGPVYDQRLDLRKPSRLLIVGDLRVPRVTVRHEVVGTGARLVVDAAPKTASTTTQQNAQIAIRFDADALDLVAMPTGLPGPNGIVQAVRQLDPITLAVDLGPRFASFRATTTPTDVTTRLTLDFPGAQETAGAPSPPGTGAQPAQPSAPVPAPAAPDLTAATASLRTIVIDPGHGGDDEGVHGANGTNEKDLVLAVARRVKTAIESRLGLRVILTREDDRAVPLDSRTALANNSKADLFISLHANASFRSSASGASIWCASFDQEELRRSENASSGGERLPVFGGGQRDIELVRWDVAQVRHVDHSLVFARLVAQLFDGRVPLAPSPVARAPLRVLEPANMPAVSIELGYLSNEAQARQVASAEFQSTVATALVDAIVRFRDALDESRRTGAPLQLPLPGAPTAAATPPTPSVTSAAGPSVQLPTPEPVAIAPAAPATAPRGGGQR